MKKSTLASLAICLAGMISCTENTESTNTAEKKDTGVVAATATDDTPAPPMDSAAKMKAWMAYMTPGDAHKKLAASDGKWKTESTMWMEPGKPPSKSTGEVTNTMMLGGRYQRMTYKGNMDGMPMEGEGTTAYDNSKKMFVSTWIDNMGTGIMTLEGPWEEAAKSMTLKGNCMDPMTGKETAIREVFTMVDDKNHTMEMYVTEKGKAEFKTMEMKMTKL